MFDVLLFDFDGTLVDSRQDLADAVNASFKAIGKPPQGFDFIVSKIGNGLGKLLKSTLGDLDEPTMATARKAFEVFYREHCMDKTDLYPGVREGLDHFRKQAKMAVVTNKPQEFAEIIVSKLELTPYVDVLIGGDALPQCKPHPAPLNHALDQLKGKRENALMIGDGHQDLNAAKAAGIKSCVVQYGFGFHDGLMELNPNYAIKKFSELKEIVYDGVNK